MVLHMLRGLFSLFRSHYRTIKKKNTILVSEFPISAPREVEAANVESVSVTTFFLFIFREKEK